MGNDVKRVVNTRFWDDDKVINEFSPEDKYFMLYLLTNKHTTQLGIYTLVPKQAAFELGYSVEAVLVLLDRFEHKYGIIQYSKETSEVAVRNYLFHSVIKGGKPVMDCLLKEEKDVIDRSLLWFVLNGLERKRQILPKKMNETVLAYMDHLKEERSKEENLYKGYQQVNININDNDNERYVHESSTNRQQINNELSEIAERFNEIKSRVISESIVMPDRGDERCEWCGNMVINLEKHHFPIPKRSGGNEVVHICHDCHKKFHDIETNNSRVKKRFIPPTIEEVDAYCLEKNLEYLCLAHNQNDQIETLVMRFLQGSSGNAVLGILNRREEYIRPLLEINRSQIEEYLKEKNLSWQTDSSNFDTKYLRNKIRHKVIPLLDEEFPGWQKAVLSGAEKQVEDKIFIQKLLDGINIEKTSDGNSVTVKDFFSLPMGMQVQLLLEIME